MNKKTGLKVKRGPTLLLKPVTLDFRPLIASLAKGVAHFVTLKFDDLWTDMIEAGAAIGVATGPSELAHKLISRALTQALFDVLREASETTGAEPSESHDIVKSDIIATVKCTEFTIDRAFFSDPTRIPIVKDVTEILQRWLVMSGLSIASSVAVAARFPSYFVYSLHAEWTRDPKQYLPLAAALESPFTPAAERDMAWTAYGSHLEKKIQEGVFGERFSLKQIYVPLNAYVVEDAGERDTRRSERTTRRVVVSLEDELLLWLAANNKDDAIRVVSGGPGSGKSSFAKIFSAKLANGGQYRALLVPLHLIDPTKDVVEEVGSFLRDEGILNYNPLDFSDPEERVVVIFDGLDELTSQGKAALEVARGFVRDVERTVEKRNLQTARLRVVICGREIVVQDNESEFRKARQILTLLPYAIAAGDRGDSALDGIPASSYHDPVNLLRHDLRDVWWRQYGELTGEGYTETPKQLLRRDLDEITAQPLLNYLVALSLIRKKIDFSRQVSLNQIYNDLVEAVHERAYEHKRAYKPIRHMKVADFARVLEEIGLAAWHGDGRTTTVAEIEAHCRGSGVGPLLDAFQEGARIGVTRLLAAFFFRKQGQRANGDPTFVFTHKSFGEYLAARRIVRAVKRVTTEMGARSSSPDAGWDEKDALMHWGKITGPTAMTPYLNRFFVGELSLLDGGTLRDMQAALEKLLGHVVNAGMPLQRPTHEASYLAQFQARNGEEAVLVALNGVANRTGQVSRSNFAGRAHFGAWFRRIQGQRTSPNAPLAASCLSYLDLRGVSLDIADLYGANLANSILEGATFNYACVAHADFSGANLTDAILDSCNAEGASFLGANLTGARLTSAVLDGAKFDRAIVEGAAFNGSWLPLASFEGVVGNMAEGLTVEEIARTGGKRRVRGGRIRGVTARRPPKE